MRLDGQDITPYPSGTEACDNRLPVHHGLFPHTDSAPECGLRLEIPGVKREQARQKGMRYLEMVGLGDYASAYIQEISGGTAAGWPLPGADCGA